MNEETPTQNTTSKQRIGLLGAGALLGATGLVAAVMSLGGTASAQDSDIEPETPATDVAESTVSDDLDSDWEEFGSEADWEEFETAFEEFDQCLADHGITEDEEFDDFDFDAVVMDGEESYTTAGFGEGDGTITITKVGDDINVHTSGDVTVETFTEDDFEADMEAYDEEWEQAMEACEDTLPEEVVDGDFFEEEIFDEDMLDDHYGDDDYEDGDYDEEASEEDASDES